MPRPDVQGDARRGEREPEAHEPRRRDESAGAALDHCEAGERRHDEDDEERRGRSPPAHERRTERAARRGVGARRVQIDGGDRSPRGHEKHVDDRGSHPYRR